VATVRPYVGALYKIDAGAGGRRRSRAGLGVRGDVYRLGPELEVPPCGKVALSKVGDEGG